MYTVLLVIHSILVLFLILMVLIQRTDSDGLGGLGGGGNQFLTGRGAANLLTRTTAILAAAFMLTSLVLAVMASRMTQHSILDSVTTEQSAPATAEKAKAKPVEKAAPEEKTEKKAAPAKDKADDADEEETDDNKPVTKDKQDEKTPAVPKPE